MFQVLSETLNSKTDEVIDELPKRSLQHDFAFLTQELKILFVLKVKAYQTIIKKAKQQFDQQLLVS
jgi:hypothetical protein